MVSFINYRLSLGIGQYMYSGYSVQGPYSARNQVFCSAVVSVINISADPFSNNIVCSNHLAIVLHMQWGLEAESFSRLYIYHIYKDVWPSFSYVLCCPL